MKILYAAANNENSKIALDRFVENLDKKHTLKIAAYKKSSPNNLSIDWTLDSLLNIYRPESLFIDNNDNFKIYYHQLKNFNPDLIISDLEYFTSIIAISLNIRLWQCSSILIRYALEYKKNIGIFTNYSYITNRNPNQHLKIINILDNSEEKFVYSCFGDLDSPPLIKDNYTWIRPYHKLGKKSKTCQHNIVGVVPSGNKKIFNILKKYPDTVVFTEHVEESYPNIKLKKMNEEEYYCNIYNSELFFCEGQSSLLADAYYNNKYSIVFPNFTDSESLINSTISEKMNFSSSVYDNSKNLNDFKNISLMNKYNNDISFLHEKIDKL